MAKAYIFKTGPDQEEIELEHRDTWCIVIESPVQNTQVLSSLGASI